MHSADKLAEMRTKFHVIQAKLIMSVWCFTVQCNYGGISLMPLSASRLEGMSEMLNMAINWDVEHEKLNCSVLFLSESLRGGGRAH